jgi:transketolase
MDRPIAPGRNYPRGEGCTRVAFTEDVAVRITGYGWNILRVSNSNDIAHIEHGDGQVGAAAESRIA